MIIDKIYKGLKILSDLGLTVLGILVCVNILGALSGIEFWIGIILIIATLIFGLIDNKK